MLEIVSPNNELMNKAGVGEKKKYSKLHILASDQLKTTLAFQYLKSL